LNLQKYCRPADHGMGLCINRYADLARDRLAFVRRECAVGNPLRSTLVPFSAAHLGRETPCLVGKLLSALSHQNVADRKPPPLYLLSRLKKSGLALLDSEIALE